MQPHEHTALLEIFDALNIYLFGLTLVGLMIGTYCFRAWPLLGGWFRHMFVWYLAIKFLDFYGRYKAWDTDFVFVSGRQLFARSIIGWGVWYCFLYKSFQLQRNGSQDWLLIDLLRFGWQNLQTIFMKAWSSVKHGWKKTLKR